MYSLAGLIIDRAAAGLDVSREIDTIPPLQFEVFYEDMRGLCPDRLDLGIERRPANALNVEIGQPLTRCRLRTPGNWGDHDHRATRWLLSGGEPLVLGLCSASGCPRAKRS